MISVKMIKTVTNNPPVRIYVNEIENRVTFKIKIGYHFGAVTLEAMKL